MSEPRKKKAHLQPLDAEQVDYALEQLDELHPISNIPLYQVYPILGRFRQTLGFLPQMNYRER